MSALLASEWLKVRTTRTAVGLVLALLVLVALSAAAAVGATPSDQGTRENWADLLAGTAGISTLFAVIFGILLMGGEYRHGTVTWTFLATPRRERVLTAKLVVAAFAGMVLAVCAAGLASAVGIPWLGAREFDLDRGEYVANLAGLVAGAAFWGALGVGVGTLLRNQVVAVVVALVWFLIVENLLNALWPEFGRYLPSEALDALFGGGEDEDPLPRAVGGAIALAYVVGVSALGYALTLRRDVT